MKYSRIIFLFFAVGLALSSCGRLEGDFALRRFSDDAYRKISGSFECSAREEVQWAYVFPEVTARDDIGIVIQKKEIGWIEVTSRVDYINPEKKAIHGTVKGYQPGEYQIVILHIAKDNRVLGRLKFYVYKNKEMGLQE